MHARNGNTLAIAQATSPDRLARNSIDSRSATMKNQACVVAERIVCGVALVAISRFSFSPPRLSHSIAAGRYSSPSPHRPSRCYRLNCSSFGRCIPKCAQVTAGNDPRITRIGRVMRKFKLDEFPQLWNVCAETWSWWGPTEVPPFVSAAGSDMEAVLAVRPGITDLAS